MKTNGTRKIPNIIISVMNVTPYIFELQVLYV